MFIVVFYSAEEIRSACAVAAPGYERSGNVPYNVLVSIALFKNQILKVICL